MHVTPNQAFGPEVLIEDALPELKADIEEIKSLLPRLPRQVTYQTYELSPGQVVMASGFDASRQRAVIMGAAGTGVTGLVAVGDSFASVQDFIGSWDPDNSNIGRGGPYVIVDGYTPVAFEILNQAPIWLATADTGSGHTADRIFISVMIESHAIS